MSASRSEETKGTVVVGHDGSEHADRALRWAVRAARRQSAELAVVCGVVPSRTNPETYGRTMVAREADLDAAQRSLDEAVRTAREAESTVTVRSRVVPEAPVAALLAEAEHASMLVVGSRGRGGLAGMVLGSVSTRLAQAARCPVVVVPAGELAFEAVAGDVVVGIDAGSPSSVLAFAFAEAVARGSGLTVVHSLSDPYSVGLLVPTSGDPVEHTRRAQDMLDRALEPWQATYPQVQVEQVLTAEWAPTAVLGRAGPDSLVVVGSRGRGPVAAALLGSVSHALLHTAHCPVAVVKH